MLGSVSKRDSTVEEASAEMYRLHGHAVSDSADAEFHIRLIALAYGDGCGDTQGTKRCWTDAVKPILRRYDLTDSHQAEMADVAALFDARNPIAHRFVLLTTGPSKVWRIMRYWIEDGRWHMHQVGFDELRDQVDRARRTRCGPSDPRRAPQD
jgi:hypothetical protein